MIAGKWTYRSYRNDPALVNGNAQKALTDIFGEGVFTLATPTPDTITGVFDMGGGYVLDITGKLAHAAGAVSNIAMAGVGRAGTPTDGWEYDYNAIPGYAWPTGVDQVPSFVGTVLRAKPHNGSPSGFTASFISVRQP